MCSSLGRGFFCPPPDSSLIGIRRSGCALSVTSRTHTATEIFDGVIVRDRPADQQKESPPSCRHPTPHPQASQREGVEQCPPKLACASCYGGSEKRPLKALQTETRAACVCAALFAPLSCPDEGFHCLQFFFCWFKKIGKFVQKQRKNFSRPLDCRFFGWFFHWFCHRSPPENLAGQKPLALYLSLS